MKKNMFLVMLTTLGISSVSAETLESLFDGIYVQTKNNKFVEIPSRHLYPSSGNGKRCFLTKNIYDVPVSAKKIKYLVFKGGSQKLKLAQVPPNKVDNEWACYDYMYGSYVNFRTKSSNDSRLYKPVVSLRTGYLYVLETRGVLSLIRFK